MSQNQKSLIIGILFSLPFFILNFLVVMKAEWFISLIRPENQMTIFEQVLILGLLFLIFIGGLITLSPLFKRENWQGKFFILNIIFGLLLVVLPAMLGYALGKDFYHCEVLKIPNCD